MNITPPFAFVIGLVVGLIACLYALYLSQKALNAEGRKLRRVTRASLEAITQLRDVVHGLGWSSHLSADFSKYQAQITAADTICNAAFNRTHRDFEFLSRDPGFLSRAQNILIPDFNSDSPDVQDMATLAALNLGELNTQRDAFLEHPSFSAGMQLVGHLMHQVMDGVNEKLRGRAL
jgi:hypothetical protein